LECTHENENG